MAVFYYVVGLSYEMIFCRFGFCGLVDFKVEKVKYHLLHCGSLEKLGLMKNHAFICLCNYLLLTLLHSKT